MKFLSTLVLLLASSATVYAQTAMDQQIELARKVMRITQIENTQVENKMDAAIQMQLVAEIPLTK